MPEHSLPTTGAVVLVAASSFLTAAFATMFWLHLSPAELQRPADRETPDGSRRSGAFEETSVSEALHIAEKAGPLWPLRLPFGRHSVAECAARLAAASNARLPHGVSSWREWSNSFDWGSESQPCLRRQAVMAAEATLDMKGITPKGLQRMARIAAALSDSMGYRELCRPSAFFAGLSEAATQRMRDSQPCSSPSSADRRSLQLQQSQRKNTRCPTLGSSKDSRLVDSNLRDSVTISGGSAPVYDDVTLRRSQSGGDSSAVVYTQVARTASSPTVHTSF